VNTLPAGGGATSAGRIVHDRLLELVDRLAIYESRIRHQEPGGVHKMRVTLRRLRSLLATFAPLFDAATVAGLREELRWVAGEMGGARDAEVVRKRLAALAGTVEQRAVVERINSELGPDDPASVEGLIATLDSERYGEAFRALNAFVAEPPWEAGTATMTEDTLRDLVHRDWRRLRRRAQKAREVIDRTQRQAALHEVRKAAKRLRYSAESLVPVHGRSARRLVAGSKRVQVTLGELQDSVIAREALRAASDRDSWEVEEQQIISGLYAREQRRAARAEDRYARAWSRLAKKKNRQWLT
jgi:CHAD domain-containing protein